jgi:hypothetical protein
MKPRIGIVMGFVAQAVMARAAMRVEYGAARYSLKGGNATIEYTDRIIGRGLTRKQVLRAQRSTRLRFTGPNGFMEGISAAEEHNDGHGHLAAWGLAPNALLRRLVGGNATHDVVDDDGHADIEAEGSRINRGYGVSDVGAEIRLPNGETAVHIHHRVTSEAGYYPSTIEAFATGPARLGWTIAKSLPFVGWGPRLVERGLGTIIVGYHGLTVRPADAYARIINQDRAARRARR